MLKKTLCVIAASLCVTATAGAAPPADKDWGALAFSSPHASIYGWAVNYSSKEAAERAAVEACNTKEARANGNRTCRVHEWFHGECGALAVHPTSDGKVDKFGWAHAKTRTAAELAAMQACQANGGTACRIEVWACNKE